MYSFGYTSAPSSLLAKFLHLQRIANFKLDKVLKIGNVVKAMLDYNFAAVNC